MSAEGKKNQQYTRELHFVVPLAIDEVDEYLHDLGVQGIRVSVERETPEERKLRLEYWDEIKTTVYVRLSVWNASETRIEMTLSRGFYLSPKVYIPLVLVAGVMLLLDFTIKGTILNALMLFGFMIAAAIFIYTQHIQETNNRERFMSIKSRKNAGYVMDAVVELFKKQGAAILLERSTDEDFLRLEKSKFVADFMREDDANRSDKSKRR